MIAVGALAALSSLLTSSQSVLPSSRTAVSSGVSPRGITFANFEEEQYLQKLQWTVFNLSQQVGLATPERGAWYDDSAWIKVLEERLSDLELQLHRQQASEAPTVGPAEVQETQELQRQRYVQRLEQQLLTISMTYDIVDAVVDAPIFSERHNDENYITALEEAVTTLESKVSCRTSDSDLW
jgi:hypothetical protein